MNPMAHRATTLLATIVSALTLALALASERLLGLVPCALCLLERWPYRIAMGIGLVAFLAPRVRVPLMAVMALVLLLGAGLGMVHVGVEHGWWPSPLPECAAPDLGSGTMSERLARMPLLPSKPCDEPTYLIPGVPLSMAAMNMGLGLVLAAFLAISAATKRRSV